jgi:prespore-specific regulator
MPMTRQDAWTQDEDLILAETVLRHIREGGTQLKAFDEVGKRLSRTGAACGFRWNSFVRKQYQSGIELAKKQRKELKKQHKKAAEPEEEAVAATEAEAPQAKAETLGIEEVKEFLDKLNGQAARARAQEKNSIQFEERIKELESQLYYLSSENEKLRENLAAVERDHRSLLEIMERARKMVGTNSEIGEEQAERESLKK